MNEYGIYFGHFYPPHRGHLQAIFSAGAQCDHLFVVISNDNARNQRESEAAGIHVISGALRLRWLCQELSDFDYISVLMMDETDIPQYPEGFGQWIKLLLQTVRSTKEYRHEPKPFTFFVGDSVYTDALKAYGHVQVYDIANSWYPIRSAVIRKDPYTYWDYILGSARPFFATRVLITGTESTGKTSLTKILAKLYHTSWSYEVGRYYTHEFMGDNEEIYTDVDFMRLAHLQYEQDEQALHNANRVCFFDTDAVVTQYYSELYLGHRIDYIENFAKPVRYDLVLMLTPEVAWIDDGMRLNGDPERRWNLHRHLKQMYEQRGFKILEIGGDYKQRMDRAVAVVDDFMDDIYPRQKGDVNDGIRGGL